jgi:hypothetical protein
MQPHLQLLLLPMQEMLAQQLLVPALRCCLQVSQTCVL